MSETQADPQKLAKGLLYKAIKDIKAAEILHRENLKDLAIFHLEQASEKILKAYFIGFPGKLLDNLLETYEFAIKIGVISTSDKYNELHQRIKEIINQLTNPKLFRHDFVDFLDKKLGDWCDNIHKFKEYFEFLLKGFADTLGRQKQAAIKWFLSKGLNEEQAKNGVNSIISFISQIIDQMITYFKLIINVCNKEAIKLLPIKAKELSKKIKESPEPCLYNYVKIYRLTINKLRKLIKELTEKNSEAIKIISKIIMPSRISNDKKLKTFIANLIYYIMLPLPIFMLPLHLCLYKYYEISRYPEGKIPVKEYKVIPETIELLKDIHKSVKRLIRLHLEFEHLFEQVIVKSFFSNN